MPVSDNHQTGTYIPHQAADEDYHIDHSYRYHIGQGVPFRTEIENIHRQVIPANMNVAEIRLAILIFK